MEQEFKYEDLYTVLDEEYDSYAADLMFFQNETNLIQSHIKKIKDKVKKAEEKKEEDKKDANLEVLEEIRDLLKKQNNNKKTTK